MTSTTPKPCPPSTRYNEVPVERLREVFDYDPATGALTWRVTLRGGNARRGKPAGNQHPNGYRYTTLDQVRLQVSRICFAMHHGRWPEGQIDHRNRNRGDNRIDNLREATPGQNLANKGAMARNVLGVKGVQKHHAGSGYVARIRGKYLGLYRTVEEASEAYQRAARELWGEFTPQED